SSSSCRPQKCAAPSADQVAVTPAAAVLILTSCLAIRAGIDVRPTTRHRVLRRDEEAFRTASGLATSGRSLQLDRTGLHLWLREPSNGSTQRKALVSSSLMTAARTCLSISAPLSARGSANSTKARRSPLRLSQTSAPVARQLAT